MIAEIQDFAHLPVLDQDGHGRVEHALQASLRVLPCRVRECVLVDDNPVRAVRQPSLGQCLAKPVYLALRSFGSSAP